MKLPKSLALTGASLTVIARRQDRDDVLFALSDGGVAIVHLTYSRERERQPDLPSTWLYGTLDRFVEEAMRPAHREWE